MMRCCSLFHKSPRLQVQWRRASEVANDMISSRLNPKVQALVRLRERSERESRGRFLIEGQRELTRAVASGRVALDEAYYCPDFFCSSDPAAAADLVAHVRSSGVPCWELGASAFEKVSGRQGTLDGLIGVARTWDCSLALLSSIIGENGRPPLFLVVEAIEKPGNLGALLRVADSAGADAVIVCDPVTDVFNPSTIRAAQGALFSIPVAVCSHDDDVAAWLKSRSITAVATSPGGRKVLWDVDCRGPVALVMGSEANGLSMGWLCDSNAVVASLPQAGLSDSLNVSVAAGIMLYEVARQRRL